MALVDEMTDEEVNEALARYEQTDPKLQRRIMLEAIIQAAAAKEEVNHLGRINAALFHACQLGLGSANDAMILAVQFNCRQTEAVSRERIRIIETAISQATA